VNAVSKPKCSMFKLFYLIPCSRAVSLGHYK